ncbi:MAG TPA: tRNA methyl transferase PRC-barrel domain-containing protein, partial [Anaerolineales bacterium]|nr:tRNA methyl transferase PRC-barrel domain-containing protein [Anaerolineales bacterium]
EELSRSLFPLGSLTKDEVRKEAHRRGLAAANRPESQDLCFLGGRDYREVLKDLDGSSLVPGPILSTDGERLGEHQGLPAYTIGQRKGIGLAAAEPFYVIAKDVSRNALIVGPRSARGRREFFTAPPSWIAGHAPEMPASVEVQIRYHSPARAALVEAAGEGRLRVTLDEAAPDVAAGQYAMFYAGDRVLGGGMILL